VASLNRSREERALVSSQFGTATDNVGFSYRVPAVPSQVRVSAEAQSAYLLEDAFFEAPDGALAEKIRSGRSLRVKFGVDPTAPAVTWGWSVPLRRLRRFQELGHTAVLVLGDYTAQVGDPSGRSATRRRLTAEEVDGYVESCLHALLAILSPDNLEVRRNSEWIGAMNMEDVLRLASEATVAQLLEREDFDKRFKTGQPISLIEFMYPLLQGYDSVKVEADIELGGSDQLFNFLLARDLQAHAGQDSQSLVCAPLLVGTDGRKKMSQSVGNYIGIDSGPKEIFGKAMSIPDDAMAHYVSLALDLSPDEKESLLVKAEGVELKRTIAREMAAMFYGSEAAEQAEHEFNRVFRERALPDEIGKMATTEHYLPRVVVDLGWAASLSAARRLIDQRGLRVDGEVVDNANASLAHGEHLLQAGKRRFMRVDVSDLS
jgi:tyrosyl-tRNA synthetase